MIRHLGVNSRLAIKNKQFYLNQKLLRCKENKILNYKGFLNHFFVGPKLPPVLFYGGPSFYKKGWEHYILSKHSTFRFRKNRSWFWYKVLGRIRARGFGVYRKSKKKVKHLNLMFRVANQQLKRKFIPRLRKGSMLFLPKRLKGAGALGGLRLFYLRRRSAGKRSRLFRRKFSSNFYSGLFFNRKLFSLFHKGELRRYMCVLTFRFTRKNLFFILSDKFSGHILMAKQMVAFPHLYETKRHKFYRENILHILEEGFFPFLFKYIKGTNFGYKYIAYSFKGFHPFLKRRGRVRYLSFFVRRLMRRLLRHRNRLKLRAQRRLKAGSKKHFKLLAFPPVFYSFTLNFARAFNGCRLRPYKSTSKALRWRFKKKRRNIHWRIKRRTRASKSRVCLDLKDMHFYRPF